MKIFLQCLLFLSCNALADAAEILAWKAPISAIAPEGLDVPGVTRLEKPPEASPFFGPKDELWDIMALAVKPDKERSASPEWVAWNATSGRIVAKGSWLALSAIEPHFGSLSPPIQGRIKIDLYQVRADGSPPDESKPPDYSCSFVARSGQAIDSLQSEGKSSIHFDGELYLTYDDALMDLKVFVSASLPNGPELEIQTYTMIEDGSRLWLAREFNGKQGMDIMVTATCELSDGTPFSNIILRQEGNAAVPFLFPKLHSRSGSIAMGENRKLFWSKFGPQELSGLLPNALKNDELDPEKFKEVRAPEVLAPHFFGPVYELSEIVKRCGINIQDSDFVGYDFKDYCVFMYSSDKNEIDKFEQLFSNWHEREIRTSAITSRGDGEMRLMSNQGIRALIKSTYPELKLSREFVIEPSVGYEPAYMDLRITYDKKIDGKSINSLESAVTLEFGKFLKVFEKSKADGSKSFIELKAERLKYYR